MREQIETEVRVVVAGLAGSHRRLATRGGQTSRRGPRSLLGRGRGRTVHTPLGTPVELGRLRRSHDANGASRFERVRPARPRAAVPQAYFEQDWTVDEWARGGYGAHFAPGVPSEYEPALWAPVGRLHWAGAETSTEWHLYMHRAVQSGEWAAREVLAELRGDAPARPFRAHSLDRFVRIEFSIGRSRPREGSVKRRACRRGSSRRRLAARGRGRRGLHALRDWRSCARCAARPLDVR
ncbi:flavin-dependent amine oxidoreductase [Deinococcus yavapaiensis KR-236]|uniref:Flavin-dependent amine oxidoreductase n=1 Tax=Deinococcus yavapaiensis KR-236 TaxID=694435 RepID=A0A318S9E8_9DEIO|nr:flavin-dependent amine oxidoreductase [Deinococcus yavapaiensis KR-236]